jgi:integrase
MNKKQKKSNSEWRMYRGISISTKPILPGVWGRREGGHLVRARATDPSTGKVREIFKVLPDYEPADALKYLRDEQARIRAGLVSPALPKPRFSEFAVSLLEEKIASGDIKSAKGKQKWADVLVHFIEGTTGKVSKKYVVGFGDVFIDRLSMQRLAEWRVGMGQLIAAGDYKPTTVNGWLSILRVVMLAAKRRHSLPELATEGIDNFDVSEHASYTEEEPNALLPGEVRAFLDKFLELYPGHYAMVVLGLLTGLRPSSLRPLRRCGPEADVLWDEGRLLVRRSHTVGEEVMRTTKQRRRYSVQLPEEAMQILRWHVDTQLVTPEQKDSNLLFPAVNGKYRSPSVLNKPLDEVARELGLTKKITQRALRRTFNDLARAARVSDLVTRSISGHQTERMQHHYSTVNHDEQRAALSTIAEVIDIKTALSARRGGSEGGSVSAASG